MTDISSSSASVPSVPYRPLLGGAHTRREMLKFAAMGGLGVLLPSLAGSLTACSSVTDQTANTVLDFSTETGALNFAYALLQLECDFWARVAVTKYPGILTSESSVFSTANTDCGTAQVNLANTIGSGRITGAVTFRLGDEVDYSDRTSTLTAARIMEDNAALGMYTIVQSYITTQAKLAQMTPYANAAKARSDAIRDMLGLPHLALAVTSPADIMTILAPYYLTTFTVIHV